MGKMYDREELITKALDVIGKEDVTSLAELWLCMGISQTTGYKYGLDDLDEIKKAIEQQKVAIKKKMRRNWRNSDNATLQIAEFKLLSSDDELSRLNTQKVNAEVAMTTKRVIFEADESGDTGQA
jgi:hypothetical protein